MGTAAMVRSMTSESSWIGVGPDPDGSVSATYTGRSTVYQVDLPASPADCAAHLEPLHPVDDLDRGAHHEVGRPVEPAAQHHRLAVRVRTARRAAPSGAGCATGAR